MKEANIIISAFENLMAIIISAFENPKAIIIIITFENLKAIIISAFENPKAIIWRKLKLSLWLDKNVMYCNNISVI